MNPIKAYAMFSLMILVLSVHVQLQTFWEPGGGTARDEAEEGPRVTMDQTLGPHYNGNTLHVGSGQTYSKIQSALDDSKDGDVIVVHPGKYIENVVVGTAVHIKGMRGAIIEGSNLIGISISCTNVTISLLAINNSNNGIRSTSMGLNISNCIFYRNTMDIRVEVINNTLTRDLICYPLEIINNTIDHGSTSNMIDITLTLGSNLKPVNISIGSVQITSNKVTNIPNRGYDVRIRETVSQVSRATLSMGDVRISNNDFTLMDYGISLTRTVTDLRDTDVDIGSAWIEDNSIINPRTQGVQIVNTFSRWGGSSHGEVGPMLVRGNRIVSTSFSSTGITLNPVQFSQCADLSSLKVGETNISSNFVNVSSRAVYINTNQPMSSCLGNASMTFGNISVWNNTAISRSNIGMNYVMSILSLNINTSASFGQVKFFENRITSSMSQGITVSLTDITSSMSGNAMFEHGGFELSGNNITSSSYSVYLNFVRVGKGTAGSSWFSMGSVSINGNHLSGSNGARVVLSDTLTDGAGSSHTSMGGIEIVSNIIKSTSQSIYLSLSNVASHLVEDRSTSLGTIGLTDNICNSNSDGVTITLDTVCFNLMGGTSFRFGGLHIDRNVLRTTTYGIQMARMRYVGETLYNFASAIVGQVSISNNTMTEGTGMNIGVFSYLGYCLFDNSTFDLEGLSIEGNQITSMAAGMTIGQASFLGNNLIGNVTSHIGDVRIWSNQVNAVGNGISINSMNMLSSVLTGSSTSEMGTLSIDDNIVVSGGIGMNFGVFGEVGHDLSGTSISKVSGLSMNGNIITSKGTGINLGTVFDLGSSISDGSKTSVGVILISDNYIGSGSDGVYIETCESIGSLVMGRSNSSVGGLRISNNTIVSDRSGVFTGSIKAMGCFNMDDSWIEIGAISFDHNSIVSNYTGIQIGFIGIICFNNRGNATVMVGRIRFDGNTIASNNSGIHIVDVMELSYNSNDNSTSVLNGLSIDDNSIDCKDLGIQFPGLSLGYQLTGRSKTHLDRITLSRNRVSSGRGISVGVDVTMLQENSSFSIGSIEVDGDLIDGSKGNGLAVNISYQTMDNSSLSIGPVSISNCRSSDANWSAVMVDIKRNISKKSTFEEKRLKLIHNNITGSSIGMNLTGCIDAIAYLNNFIGNERDVLSNATSITWTSPEKMWYRHKNANFSNYAGNYWDRYIGPDENDDGIGDITYNTGYGQDLFPFISNVDEHFPPWNDVPPPSVSIISPLDGSYLNISTIIVRWDGSDDILRIRAFSIRLDGQEWIEKEREMAHQFIDLPEGSHTVDVRAVDMAGNENSTSSTFMVDVTDPVLTLVSPQEGAFLGSNDIELVWEGSDVPSGLDRFEVRFGTWDWVDVGSDMNRTFSDVAEGEHLVQVRAWDMAGNQWTESANVVIDTIMPQLTLMNPVQDHYYNTSDLEVRWAVDDLTAIISEMDLDGTGFVQLGNATEHRLTGLIQGHHRVTVRVTDRSSHQIENEVSFTIDLLDPEVYVLSPGKYVRSSDVTVMLRANGTGSPLGALSISLNGDQWTVIAPMVGPDDVLEFDLYGMGEGDNTIHFDLPDLAGNRWGGTIMFTLDMTAPAVLTSSPTGIEVRTDILVQVDFSEVLDPEGFDLDMGVDGELSWEGSNLTFDPFARLSPDTIYSLRIEGTDLAGNPLVHSWSFTTASKGTIVGRIVDGEGEPVVGATIVLDTGETAMTGQDGRFSIGSPQGNRTVTVTYKGKVLDIFEVNITAGVETDVGDRVVQVPKGDDQRERSWTWLVILILVAVVLLLVILFLYFLLVRKGKEGVEDWGIDPDEWIEE